MSPNGQTPLLPAPPGPTAMVVGAGTMPAGLWFDTHRHPQHQIAWAARGVIAVETAHGHWVLPPTRALWIPGDLPHRTGTVAGADMRGIFLEPARCPVDFRAPTMLRVSRLLHELFDHLTATPEGAPAIIPFRADTLDAAARARAEAVVFDLLDPVEVVPIGARLPRDPRAVRVAEALLDAPADPRTLGEFAAATATSTRTLARLFRAETGLGFGEWRTQIRLAASLPLLAEGLPVARIAPRVGYASASAYVAAFRRAVGMPPVRYFAR